MNTQLDSVSIRDFEERYQLARSGVYRRLDALKAKGYPMEPEKAAGKRSIFNADQVTLMDALHEHVQQGQDIAAFPASDSASRDEVVRFHQTSEPLSRDALSSVPQDTPHLSRRTQDNDSTSLAIGFAGVIEAIATKFLDIATLKQLSPSDPLANLRALEDAAQRGWLLSTSQLAPLLGRKTLSGEVIDRYGFVCRRVGRNGAESAWAIQKRQPVES